MKKFLRKLTRTQFLLLFFIPFGLFGLYRDGLRGLITAIVGYGLGWILCDNWKAIRNFGYRKFFRKYATPLISLLILIPVDALAYHFGGCATFVAVTVGWLLGIVTWRLQKGSW